MPELIRQNNLIAFVSNSAWSVYNFRLDVISYLLNEGYQVIVFAPADEYVYELTNAGCQFVPLHFDNKSENPFVDFFFYLRLKALYREYRPDFIFHYVAKPNIYGSLAAAACSIPSVAVITGLGYAFARRNWLYYVVKFLYKTALKKSNEVWFLNNEDARVFIGERIIPIEKVKILPGEGVNTNFYSTIVRKNERVPFTFLMSTRLLKSKGVALYMHAARILQKKNYDVRFNLIGFFEDHHPDSIAREELVKWHKDGIVHYSGFARDVRPFLENADCFVFPSYYNEGVPRCLMEAASMELPIITSNNRGCKEVVLNNSTGFLCNLNDPFDLSDKMERMINLSTEERIRMGKNGRLLVLKKFNIEKVIGEYIDTLQRDLPD
ncbi:MAG TPA: glycosyltransferase family 4 protein [Flavitalea sp.]|nr:glycosyltransferase family 4 protein [Flavitalea sp.]